MAKINPGDRVIVKTDKGEGTARVVGLDPNSGVFQVVFDKIKANDGDKTVTHENVPGYVPGENLLRRKG